MSVNCPRDELFHTRWYQYYLGWNFKKISLNWAPDSQVHIS